MRQAEEVPHLTLCRRRTRPLVSKWASDARRGEGGAILAPHHAGFVLGSNLGAVVVLRAGGQWSLVRRAATLAERVPATFPDLS